MKISKLQVSKPAKLDQVYRDFSSPDHAKYHIDLKREVSALQQKINALSDEERQRYVATFMTTWKSLEPTTRRTIVGGAAGGAAGAGLALTSMNIKDIGRLIGGPVGFVVGLTVLGVVSGALTPAALSYFTENSAKVTLETPALWNFVLPKAKLEFEGKSGKKTTTGAKAAK